MKYGEKAIKKAKLEYGITLPLTGIIQ